MGDSNKTCYEKGIRDGGVDDMLKNGILTSIQMLVEKYHKDNPDDHNDKQLQSIGQFVVDNWDEAEKEIEALYSY